MNKLQDIFIDFQYKTFTIISEDKNKTKKGKYWILRCICGKEYSRSNVYLRRLSFPRCKCKYYSDKNEIVIGQYYHGYLIKNITCEKYKKVTLVCDNNHEFDKYISLLRNNKEVYCKICKKNNIYWKCKNNDIYTGLKYLSFTVLNCVNNSGGNGKHYIWNVQCDCGKIRKVKSSQIRKRMNLRCDCNINIEDLTGRTFINKNGNITVICYAGRNKINKPIWFYMCHCCGKIKKAEGEVIKRGYISTCGFCKPKGLRNSRYNPNSILRDTRRDGRRVQWCKNIFKRDNFKCVCCGKTKPKIEAHHLDGWHWCIDKRYDINNGVTVCDGKLSGCHYDFHKKYGYTNNTIAQFTEYMKIYHNKNLKEILEVFVDDNISV